MKALFLGLLFLNVVVYGAGAGWFGVPPSQLTFNQTQPKPTEFKAQEISLDSRN